MEGKEASEQRSVSSEVYYSRSEQLRLVVSSSFPPALLRGAMNFAFFGKSSNRSEILPSVTLTKRYDLIWGSGGGVQTPHDTHIKCEKSLINTKKKSCEKLKTKIIFIPQ